MASHHHRDCRYEPDRYIHLVLTQLQKESYPLPVNLFPRDFDKYNRESPQKVEEPLTTLEMAGLESLQDT